MKLTAQQLTGYVAIAFCIGLSLTIVDCLKRVLFHKFWDSVLVLMQSCCFRSNLTDQARVNMIKLNNRKITEETKNICTILYSEWKRLQ
jgi:hypothetical protein